MKNNPYKRQGQMSHLQSYFYIDTICDHKHLLNNDEMKMVVITHRNT
jgi:hypothetical protein